MADRYLLVPGTSGCKLLLDGQDIGWPGLLQAEAWICGTGALDSIAQKLGFGADELVAMLSMEFADPTTAAPTKTTLRTGSSMAPGDVLRVAYNQFSDFETFRYDWRSDVRDSGKKLLDHLEANRPSGGRWKLLAHSQGGLLAVVAARLLGTRGGATDTGAFSRLVSHVGFCACPFYGTVNSADALANGANLGGNFSRYFLQIVRTWPSIYQMLPSWPGSFSADPAAGLGDGNLLSDAAWSGIGIDPALLQRARETRQTFFRMPLVYFDNVKVRATMSVGHPTHNLASRNGTSLVPGGSERGDTLVAYDSTRKAMNDVERQVSYGLGDKLDTAVHYMLMNDPVIASDLKDFLAQ